MHQLSIFEGLQLRETADVEATAGLTQPIAYTEPLPQPRASRKGRFRSTQEVVDHLRNTIASYTEHIEGQTAIRAELEGHLDQSRAGEVDEVWLEGLIRMGAIPLEAAGENDAEGRELTYSIEGDGRYCAAICDEIHLHQQGLSEEIETYTKRRQVCQKELDELIRFGPDM